MIIVAGPPGSGKSTAFPVSGFGVDQFNADDFAANLNAGSYLRIPLSCRKSANRAFEAFVERQIDARSSFAIETTLRSQITFQQVRAAQSAGFHVEMRYLCLASFPMHIDRVRLRAKLNGHSAPISKLKRIYDASLAHLPQAIRSIPYPVYDNSRWAEPPQVLLQVSNGEILFQGHNLPDWLANALHPL